MNNLEEKRDTMRMNVNCEIYCKLLENQDLHKALCITLSSSGMSFISEQAFEINTVVEVSILPETVLIPAFRFFITIARCQAIENGNFEVGARIQQRSQSRWK